METNIDVEFEIRVSKDKAVNMWQEYHEDILKVFSLLDDGKLILSFRKIKNKEIILRTNIIF